MAKETRWAVTFYYKEKTSGLQKELMGEYSNKYLTDKLFKTEDEALAFYNDKKQVGEFIDNNRDIQRYIKNGRIKRDDVLVKVDETYILPII